MSTLLATLAYNRPDFVLEGLQFFREHSDKSEYDRHVLFNPHYPIPDAKINDAVFEEIAKQYNLEYVPMKNYGSHQNFQYAMEYMGGKDGDVFIPVCPDARGRNKGWVKALTEILKVDQDCFYACLNRDIDYGPYRPALQNIAGHNVLKFPQLVAWSLGGFNCGLLNSIGGICADSAQYGYIEVALDNKFKAIGKHWLMLGDYYDSCCAAPDLLYNEWKQASAAKQTALEFSDWLKGKT